MSIGSGYLVFELADGVTYRVDVDLARLAPIAAAPPSGDVTIDNLAPAQGDTLTASNTISDPDGINGLAYQWQRGASNIDGATWPTYTAAQGDVGNPVRVVASYTTDAGLVKRLTSAATAPVLNVNDPPSGAVSIDNTAPAEGDTLTASHTLTDADGLSGPVSYQWQRDGIDIAGATGASYTTTQDDIGAAIRVVASYTDDQGSAESVASAATALVTNTNQVPTGGVYIDNLAPGQGETLTASHDLVDPDGLGSISYQWQRAGVDIASATGSSYTTTQADVGAAIRVVASYTDAHGAAESVTSGPTAPVTNVNDPPSGSVSIDNMVPTEGDTLTASHTLTDVDGISGPISYQWQRDGEDVYVATGSTYALTQADVGAAIRVIASYTDDQGAAESVASAATAPVINVNQAPTGTLTIDNLAPAQGETLTPYNDLDDIDGLGSISYQWQRDGVDIVGATGSSYTTTQADVGAAIRVVASYTDAQGTAESVTSGATAPVSNVNDLPSGAVSIDNTMPAQGDTLTASHTLTDLDGISGPISYQWQRNGVDIVDATGSSYTTTQADVGASIGVVASYTDDQGGTESVASAITNAVTNVNDPPSGAVTIDNTTPALGDTLTASHTLTDLDGISGPISYQWQRDGANIPGAQQSTYTTTIADVGAAIRVVATYEDDFGFIETVASGFTDWVGGGDTFYPLGWKLFPGATVANNVVSPEAPEGGQTMDYLTSLADEYGAVYTVDDALIEAGKRYSVSAWMAEATTTNVTLHVHEGDTSRNRVYHDVQFTPRRFTTLSDPFKTGGQLRAIFCADQFAQDGYIVHTSITEGEGPHSYFEGSKVADELYITDLPATNEVRVYFEEDYAYQDFDDVAAGTPLALAGDTVLIDGIVAYESRPPVITSVEVAASGTSGTITFDRDISGTAGLTLTAEGRGALALSGLTAATNTITFTCAQAYAGEGLALSYDEITGTIVNDQGVSLEAFWGTWPVTNLSTVVAPSPTPVVQSIAARLDGADNKLDIVMSTPVTWDNTGVTATIGGVSTTLSAPVVDGATITVTAADPIYNDDAVLVSFDAVVGTITAVTGGNTAASWTDTAVNVSAMPTEGGGTDPWSVAPAFAQADIDTAVAHYLTTFKFYNGDVKPMNAGQTGVSHAAPNVMHYLAIVARVDPAAAATDTTLVVDRLIEHFDSVLTGGNEPQVDGHHHAFADSEIAGAIAVMRQTPTVWSQLTATQKDKADWYMRICTYVGSCLAHANNQWKTFFDLGGAGGYNPNQYAPNVKFMVAAHMYFGGEAAVNAELAAFDWAATLAAIDTHGWTNIRTIWNNGGATLRNLLENGGTVGDVSCPGGITKPFVFKGISSVETSAATGGTQTYDPPVVPYTPFELAKRQGYDWCYSLEVTDESVGINQAGCAGERGHIRPGFTSPHIGSIGMPFEYNIGFGGKRTKHHYAVYGLKHDIMLVASLMVCGYWGSGGDYDLVRARLRIACDVLQYRQAPDDSGRWFSFSNITATSCGYNTDYKQSTVAREQLDDLIDAVIDASITWSGAS